MAIRRSDECTWLSSKWAGDDAADAVCVAVFSCDAADGIEPIEGYDVFVSRDLQNRIRRGVKNRIASAHMLGSEFREHGCAAARVVADEFHASIAFDRFDEVVREPLVDRERFA